MMKMLLADSPEARQLTIVPELARRLDGATRSDLPFTATPEHRMELLQSVNGTVLQEFDAEDMAPTIEVTQGHDGQHPDTVFVVFMRDFPEDDQKHRALFYWPDGRPYALFHTDSYDADYAADR